jgi:uncharacterized membrane protein affecting hemolysin expression
MTDEQFEKILSRVDTILICIIILTIIISIEFVFILNKLEYVQNSLELLWKK